MLRKNLTLIIVVLLALVLMALVIWVFNRRIEKIGKENKATSSLLVPA
jgi:cbb3-type cytochrome oxidase subunit 3